ncbi:hypothetical protein HMPREF3150_01968 [Pseudomonas aeruginosa]|nr:hypothetical protein HMPREF3150_01968 [Pseudomonas aeruginosa]
MRWNSIRCDSPAPPGKSVYTERVGAFVYPKNQTLLIQYF